MKFDGPDDDETGFTGSRIVKEQSDQSEYIGHHATIV